MDPRHDIPEYSYAARRGRRPDYDPLMRRIALIAGGVAALVIVVALIWSGIRPGAGFGPPPEIKPPPEPLRVAPANPGGLAVPGADQEIMSGQSTVTPSSLAPVAPAPDISAFQPPPPPPAPPPPTPPAPVALAAPAPAAPATVPAAAQDRSALAPVAPVAPAASGPVQVQLAAVLDAAAAHATWAQLSRKMPALLAGHTPIYSRARVAGVTFYRLRLGGFADMAAARRFCAAMTAQGQACSVATF